TAPIVSRTHRSAATQSSTARLSGAPGMCPKPSTPSREEIVTTTTPERARVAPSNHGLLGEPLTEPPPWTHTYTGSGSAGAAGAVMLTLRISSPGVGGSGIEEVSDIGGSSGVGPGSTASRTPDQPGCGAGAANRRS